MLCCLTPKEFCKNANSIKWVYSKRQYACRNISVLVCVVAIGVCILVRMTSVVRTFFILGGKEKNEENFSTYFGNSYGCRHLSCV